MLLRNFHFRHAEEPPCRILRIKPATRRTSSAPSESRSGGSTPDGKGDSGGRDGTTAGLICAQAAKPQRTKTRRPSRCSPLSSWTTRWRSPSYASTVPSEIGNLTQESAVFFCPPTTPVRDCGGGSQYQTFAERPEHRRQLSNPVRPIAASVHTR